MTSKIKYVFKYLSNVLTWTLFIVLISLAIILGYYFISMKVYATKGENYKPPFSIYTIVSGSMIPSINVDDVVVNVDVSSPAELQVGDVITFISSSSISYGMTVTHRIKDIQIVNGEYQFITKGDANLSADGAPAPFKNVIGKAIFRIPQLGKVQKFIASKFGWVIIILIPALYIIVKDIMTLVKVYRLQKKSKEENGGNTDVGPNYRN